MNDEELPICNENEVDMKKNMVILEKTNDGGYSAYVPELPGCVASADTLPEMKRIIGEAVDFHIDGMKLESLQIPGPFQGEFDLSYKMDIASLFDWFSGVLTKSGISRLTGMNQSLISQYASGIKTPSSKQSKKIENAIHSLGREILEIEL